MSANGADVRRGFFAGLLRRMNLRFPTVFALLLIVTVVDWLTPDVIPFADEIALTLLTLLFGLWKDRRAIRTP